MREDPGLAARFQKRAKEDEAFAKSPEVLLQCFYRMHPSGDVLYGVSPVVRGSLRGIPERHGWISEHVRGSYAPCRVELHK